MESIESILMSLRNSFGTYHQHKENMAWVATSLYFAAMLGITAYLYKYPFESSNLNYLGIVLVIIFGCIVANFVFTQLKYKAIAANTVYASTKLICDLLSGTRTINAGEDFKFNNEEKLPNVLVNEMMEQMEIEETNFYKKVKLGSLNWKYMIFIAFITLLPISGFLLQNYYRSDQTIPVSQKELEDLRNNVNVNFQKINEKLQKIGSNLEIHSKYLKEIQPSPKKEINKTK